MTTNPFEVLEQHILSLKSEVSDLRDELRSRTKSEKKYYTIKEAASKLNVARLTVYRNTKNGNIPRIQIGSRVMVPASWVDGQVRAN
jgi:excisionase family DNA binding protein